MSDKTLIESDRHEDRPDDATIDKARVGIGRDMPYQVWWKKNGEWIWRYRHWDRDKMYTDFAENRKSAWWEGCGLLDARTKTWIVSPMEKLRE
jgi:hypothetical protein